MLDALSGETHAVVSGLCLRTVAWEVVEHAETFVTFRALTAAGDRVSTSRAASGRDARAAYAIQGLGASLVDRVDEATTLNVVGLPGRAPRAAARRALRGVYGFG
jgi:predicted house-cleaning NTP pyrophosphatase (Maf/HAM1 superfamily)